MGNIDLFEDVYTFSVVDRILTYLNGTGQTYDEALTNAIGDSVKWTFVRQIMEEREPPKAGFRASLAGPCARQMAYKKLGIPEDGKEIDARAKMTFLVGDLLEIAVVALIKLAGIKTRETLLDGSQEKVVYRVPGTEIDVPGSPDGVIEVQEGLDQDLLLEVKSASDASFKKTFSRGKLTKRYALQHQIYMAAKGLGGGRFVIVNKNSGALAEIFTIPDPVVLRDAEHNYNTADKATIDNLPPRYHDGSDYGLKVTKKEGLTPFLAPLCSYCGYRNTCWDNPYLEIRNRKPQYRVKTIPKEFLNGTDS